SSRLAPTEHAPQPREHAEQPGAPHDEPDRRFDAERRTLDDRTDDRDRSDPDEQAIDDELLGIDLPARIGAHRSISTGLHRARGDAQAIPGRPSNRRRERVKKPSGPLRTRSAAVTMLACGHERLLGTS